MDVNAVAPTTTNADHGRIMRGRSAGGRPRVLGRTVVLGVVLALLGAATLTSPAIASSSTPGPATSTTTGHGWGPLTHGGLSRFSPGATGRHLGSGAASGRARRGATTNVPVGQNPVVVAVDQSSGTVYVGNAGQNTVSIIDGARCNSINRAGCSKTPTTVTVGMGPLGLAIDQATHTLYVVNSGDNTVSVINTATCNARTSTGCGAVRTIAVGNGPIMDAVDQATDTVYVANFDDNTVSVIDGATCNGTVGSGCAAVPKTVHVGEGPQGLAVDEATDTVYSINSNDNTVSVINGATCNSRTSTGCGHTPAKVTVGGSPDGAVVDQRSHTVYVIYDATTPSAGGVALIDGSRCNGQVHSGCARAPGVVQAGSGPIWVAENPVTGTVYVANQEDSNVSVINARTCNAAVRSGCTSPLPALTATFNAGGIDIDVATDTIYYASQGENVVSVLDGSRCNSQHKQGCTRYAPTTTTGNGPGEIAVNERTNTLYVTNQEDGTVSVVNSATCNVRVRTGCGRPSPTIAVGRFPNGIAVDERTDTVYVSNLADNTVSVIDGATCNARDHAGCGQIPTTVAVGNGPFRLALNDVTGTIYVANGGGDANHVPDNTVSVINAATCNANVRSGCAKTPPVFHVGNGPFGIAVNDRTNTVYVANSGDDTLSVMNGATCDAQTTAGCGHAPAVVAAGPNPVSVAVDQSTDTVYVAGGPQDQPANGSLAVVNGATCNGQVTTGCTQTPHFMTTGGMLFTVAVDQATHRVYGTSVFDSDLEIFNGSTCNSQSSRGCGQTPAVVNTGGWPSGMATNPRTNTVYVANNVDATLSLFPTTGQSRRTH